MRAKDLVFLHKFAQSYFYVVDRLKLLHTPNISESDLAYFYDNREITIENNKIEPSGISLENPVLSRKNLKTFLSR